MSQIPFEINQNSKKRLDTIFKNDAYVLLGSPFNAPDHHIKSNFLSEISEYIDLDILNQKSFESNLQVDGKSKIFIQLPDKKGLFGQKIYQILKDILAKMKPLDIKIMPVYIVKRMSDEREYYHINTGRIIDVNLYLYKNNVRSLVNFIDAQFRALQVNFNLSEFKGILSTNLLPPIISPIDSRVIKTELANLPPGKMVYKKHDYEVYICNFESIPNLIKEIGRVREITFRGVGEGTGRSFDLDSFDLHYLQLFIWDIKYERLVGGYRLGLGHEIVPEHGLDGLYISKLFKIKKKLLPILSQGLEMGRSFVLPDYQKQRLPLFLLWRGILELITRYPQIKYLYGPVSISKAYSNISKDLMIEFIRANYYDKKMARLLKPRKPYKVGRNKKEYKAILTGLNGQLTDLDDFIESIEPSHMRVPVLIKQYIKQNARFIGFNMDPNFSDALDGFVVLDLSKFPDKTMELLKNK